MNAEKQKFREILNKKLSTGKPFDILMCNEVMDEYFVKALSEKEEDSKKYIITKLIDKRSSLHPEHNSFERLRIGTAIEAVNEL